MFFKLLWNISVKEIFSFQKLKIPFREILFQKKPPHALLILLFELLNREKYICKNEKSVLQWIVKISNGAITLFCSNNKSCLAKNDNNHREYVNGENVFRHVDNCIREKHGSK